ncbi:hypothetical protein Pyn_40526 [Prunus yedoensis var. nudiflora]|uniref:Uncharacterized protein n=1 Tax=Prunus yedoensis var. nudiflora TaxID=2094558 RepID=A0A314Z4P3_PRUYE|nr:hypothetical protein Pyn_40526 [Prunus yedoensis var. nudiflora]
MNLVLISAHSCRVVSLNLPWLHFQPIVQVSLDARAVRMLHFPLEAPIDDVTKDAQAKENANYGQG